MVRSRSFIATPPGATIKEQLNDRGMSQKEFCPRIKNCLADYGIAPVFLPHLKGSFLQGASFMDGNKIVVGLTARGKDADNFWFSLFHELAHIALGHVGQPNGTSADDEKAADRRFGDTLITSEDFETFRREKDYSERSVIRFAREQGIAPGIVVGRMQLIFHLSQTFES